MKILILCTLFVLGSAQAFGVECSTNNPGEDNFMKVTLNEASVEFQLHESFFEINESKIANGFGGNYVIPETNVEVSAEGETFDSKVESIILFDGTSAKIYLAMNGYTHNRTLSCK